MATIQTLNPTDVIKETYGKINTSLTNLNNAKMEKTADSDLNMNGRNISNVGTMTTTGFIQMSALRGLEYRTGDVATTSDLVNFPEVATENVIVRLFRVTNTTGSKYFQVTKGDGTTATAFEILNGAITTLNGQNVTITAGTGSPQGVVAARPGSIYLNTAGGANATIWVKESGTGNTGWVAK